MPKQRNAFRLGLTVILMVGLLVAVLLFFGGPQRGRADPIDHGSIRTQHVASAAQGGRDGVLRSEPGGFGGGSLFRGGGSRCRSGGFGESLRLRTC